MTQDSGQPVTTSSHPSVPEPPRPVTEKARKRTWAEPQVRGWLLFTVALLLGAAFLAIRSINEWNEETRVVRSGVVVKAVAWHAGSQRVPNQTLTSTSPVDLEYEYQGKKYKPTSQTLYKTGTEYVSMEPFDIHIDPENPENWTNRTDAPPMIEKMMGVFIMLVVAVISAVITLVLRQRWASLWVHGDHVMARILGQSQSALAPHSVGLRCVVRDGRTDHLVTVYVPQNTAPAEGAQTIELIASANRSRALALANYHS